MVFYHLFCYNSRHDIAEKVGVSMSLNQVTDWVSPHISLLINLYYKFTIYLQWFFILSSFCYNSRHDIAEVADLVLSNNHSLICSVGQVVNESYRAD